MTQPREKNGRWRKSRVIATCLVLGMVGIFVAAQVNKATATTNYQTVEKIVKVKDDSPTPVLERIAKCESGSSHYDKNGQVHINKTQDIGKYQINVPIWGKKATELKLNLAIEADNEKFARYLYDNYGTEPWIHTRKCWNA